MLKKTLTDFNKFYLAVGIVLMLMTVLVIITARTVFTSFSNAGQIDANQSAEVQVDGVKLREVRERLENRQPLPLDLTE